MTNNSLFHCRGLVEYDRPPLRWYALHVRSNFERQVCMHLEQKRVEAFLPTYVTERRWSDRIKKLNIPLFPGYVFSRIEISERLPVLTVPGVIRIVGSGKEPAPIEDDQIESIRLVVNSRARCEPSVMEPGERVLIDRGPLMGVQGTLLRTGKSSRIVVSIDVLQRSVAVEVEQEWIRPINGVRIH